MDKIQKSLLDEHLRLRLGDLTPEIFERFFLHFLNAGISLEIERDGTRIERRIIEVNTYATGTGRSQEGVDLVARVEGGETWVFQCKRWSKWTPSDTKKAIEKAASFPAQHYFLLVACDPHEGVQKLIAQHPKWTFWNLDRICAELRLRVPRNLQPQVLFFLSPEELRRFAPYASDAFISPADYLAAVNRSDHSFHHRYPLVGRETELAKLHDFASESPEKVMLLSAKGGEGKSRLLWEFARAFQESHKDVEVAFLNPHSGGDIPTALWDPETPRLLLVDDAHRLERVSRELLACVRQGTTTKLILATRPQGNEALEERLREHGLWESTRQSSLHKLKKADIKKLAKGALGPEFANLVEPLADLTGDSPFLTALAGDLLRRGKLEWGSWSSDREFYTTVLRSFEQDNLLHLAAADQALGSRLLKIIAMLTPVAPDAVFFARAAECLQTSEIEVEAIFQRLQASGVISAEKKNVRVIPDLFSDFLVFETAFDASHRLPMLTSAVLKAFSEQSAALLRNLAEAAWVARTENIDRSELMRPLLEAEFSRFDRLGFFERARMLEEWSAFSVYLPEESLELARKAIKQDTVPSDRPERWQMYFDGIESHQYTKSHVPSLLKPIAKWHDAFRHEALDVLWELGAVTPKTFINANKNHPWEVIADVCKFEPRKSVHVIEATLEWIDNVVRRPGTKALLESPQAVLSTLLSPCFERHVEFVEWHGRNMKWWTQPVNLQRTARLRDRALKILRWVVENRSWVAAVQVVGALSHALKRVAPCDTSRVSDPEKFMEDWRPERLKALELLPEILDRHSQVPVRFAIRQWLLRDLAYEEDSVFAEASRKIISGIPEDLNLRLAIATLTEGHYEFSEQLGKPSGAEFHKQSEELWNIWQQELAREFIRAYPSAEAGAACLEAITADCVTAGYSPRFIYLFPAIGRVEFDYAVKLTEALLRPEYSGPVSLSWYQLLFGMESNGEIQRLLENARSSPRSEIRTGVIHFLCFRNRGNAALSSAERAMIESLAEGAGEAEIAKIVQLVQWLDATNAPWGFQLLQKLPLETVAERLYPQFLDALFPYRAREAPPPLSTVEHVLDAMVSVSEIDVDHSDQPFTKLVEGYPKAVYDFVIKRLQHAEQAPEASRYRALPKAIHRRFRLASISKENDYAAICEFLWNQVVKHSEDRTSHDWIELFQGIVLENEPFWVPRLLTAIEAAKDLDELRDLLDPIKFDGSLIIFEQPAITTAFLRRAEDLDGTAGVKRIRAALYSASGPDGRSYSSGILDPEYDYLEAEAFKAADEHADDTLLGPFYRGIGEAERHDREFHRKLHEAEMASLDDE